MSRDITKLQGFTQLLANELVEKCKALGLNVKITDCVRTQGEQNSLGASVTNAKYPYSFHNWGLAFDICQNDKNCAYPSDNKWWEKVGKIGEGLGLEWGGRWTKPVDKPHFQLNAYGTVTHLIKVYGAPSMFMTHSDYKIKTPATAITTVSSFKKILWLQIRLNYHGYHTTLTGKWDKGTKNALKLFWLMKTGKSCTGKLCTVKCIDMLK